MLRKEDFIEFMDGLNTWEDVNFIALGVQKDDAPSANIIVIPKDNFNDIKSLYETKVDDNLKIDNIPYTIVSWGCGASPEEALEAASVVGEDD